MDEVLKFQLYLTYRHSTIWSRCLFPTMFTFPGRLLCSESPLSVMAKRLACGINLPVCTCVSTSLALPSDVGLGQFVNYFVLPFTSNMRIKYYLLSMPQGWSEVKMQSLRIQWNSTLWVISGFLSYCPIFSCVFFDGLFYISVWLGHVMASFLVKHDFWLCLWWCFWKRFVFG